MNKDTITLIKDSASTLLNIAQMTQYRMKYVQDRDVEAKEKMYKNAFLSGVGSIKPQSCQKHMIQISDKHKC